MLNAPHQALHAKAPHAEVQHATQGMVDYAENSSAQRNAILGYADRIAALAASLGRIEPELRLADYGCGFGQSAIDAVSPAIEAYRQRFPEAPIAVCHADQPGNDWNALFALVNGPAGYLREATTIRSEAAVGSFYDQMVTAGSVGLGTCFAASHWLNHAPRLHAPGILWFADLQGEARRQLAAVARGDWIRFLRCRAAELRSGGALLVFKLGAIADAQEANGAAASGRGIYRALQQVAQQMADEGLLDPKVLDDFVFGLWFMTEEEAREPIESDPVLAKAFAIEEIGVKNGPADVFAESIGEPALYARRYTGFTRAFADSTLHTQLFAPSAKDPAQVERLDREFWARFETLYRNELGKRACEYWPLTVVLRRR